VVVEPEVGVVRCLIELARSFRVTVLTVMERCCLEGLQLRIAPVSFAG